MGKASCINCLTAGWDTNLLFHETETISTVVRKENERYTLYGTPPMVGVLSRPCLREFSGVCFQRNLLYAPQLQ